MGLPRRSRSKTHLKEPPLKDVASTPIASKRSYSPPWLGDDSPIPDSPSPIPFMCTQDAGENEVVWNFNSPKSRPKGLQVRDTPVRKRKEMYNFTESPISSMRHKAGKRRLVRNTSTFKNDYLKELSALNKCIIQIQENKKLEDSPSCSNEENICPDITPLKHINERLSKCDNEGIESDDSMNEHLFQASQLIEKQIVDQVSKEAEKKLNASVFQNDSFDSLLCNINDSLIEVLTQAPNVHKEEKPVLSDKENNFEDSLSNLGDISCLLNGTIVNEKKKFGRHQSMPMSPSAIPVKDCNLNSSFSRHNSMPLDTEQSKTEIGSSCTQLEIQRKRKAAMEKLMSKKQKSNDSVFNNNTKPSKESVQDLIEKKKREAQQRLRNKLALSQTKR